MTSWLPFANQAWLENSPAASRLRLGLAASASMDSMASQSDSSPTLTPTVLFLTKQIDQIGFNHI